METQTLTSLLASLSYSNEEALLNKNEQRRRLQEENEGKQPDAKQSKQSGEKRKEGRTEGVAVVGAVVIVGLTGFSFFLSCSRVTGGPVVLWCVVVLFLCWFPSRVPLAVVLWKRVC